ncbi:DNA repair/transcription protein mms19 [Exophiala dermatitidis]
MALSDARDYVLAVESDKREAAEIAKSTAQKLETRQTTLIDVVQSLGEYINDGDDKIRARAISYLVAVISALPPKYLSRQQIQVLCQFLCDRIEDGGAIDGLSKLQSLDRFTNEMAQMVLRAIFEHFSDLQTRNQTGRYRVLQLVNELLEHRRKAIRDMGEESLIGITELVSGEKDPRNLMLIFSMLRVLMVEWDITKHVEMMFDSVYAYFPITFRPPPNDPYGITAQDLKDRLRDCLASTSTFAPQTFPNMLDRLDSTSNTVKKDVLQTLAACAGNYDPATMSQYSITLWDAVKFEVLQAQEPELAEEALRVLSNIARCLSTTAPSSPNSPLLQYLKPITKECLEHLQEPASRQAKASGTILKAVASASVPAFEIVIKAVGPALFTIHQSSQGLVQQRAVLEVTNLLFEASLEVYGSWTGLSERNPEGRENIMIDFKDKFVALYSQALMGTVKEEVSFRLTAANGLLLISKMRSMLSDDEIGLFVQYFNDIVLKEESYGRDELKKKAMAALAEISHFKPALISDIAFPAFLARLPDSEDEAVPDDYNPVLEGLAEISVERGLQETLMRRLLNKVDLLCKSDNRTSFPYTCSVLGTIFYVLNRATTAANSSLDAYYDRVVIGISRRTTEAKSGPLTNEAVLDLVGRIMNLIIRHSAPDKVQLAAENIYLLFRDSTEDKQSVDLLSLLEPPTVTILSTWLLAAIPRNTQSFVLNKTQIPQTITQLISFASKSTSRGITQSCLLQIALYVNKHVETADLDFVDNLLSNTLSNLQDEPMDGSPPRDFNIRAAFTLIKALILRLSPKTDQYLTSLVGLLDEGHYPAEVCRKAAMGFATILSSDDVLSRKNFAQIRLLAPQRVFQMLTPLISEKFRASQSPTEKENYLIALSGILASVPSNIVMPELPTLLPLLLQSLDVTDQMVKTATLETLAVVISNNPAALEESGHNPALVKRLIAVATLPKSRSSLGSKAAKTAPTANLPTTRRLAARCLGLLPKYVGKTGSRANPLLGLKREVLHGLISVLDDPKRDVRKEAVDARAAWLREVDDINDDDDA